MCFSKKPKEKTRKSKISTTRVLVVKSLMPKIKEIRMSLKIKEATLAADIHTVKSGSIKKELSAVASPTHKAVGMELKNINGGLFVELTVEKTKEKILVPYTSFSHLVPDLSENKNGEKYIVNEE